MNLSGTEDVVATYTAEGRKNRAVIRLEEIEKISSLHKKEALQNIPLRKILSLFNLLHRQLSTQNKQSRINCYRVTLIIVRCDKTIILNTSSE